MTIRDHNSAIWRHCTDEQWRAACDDVKALGYALIGLGMFVFIMVAAGVGRVKGWW